MSIENGKDCRNWLKNPDTHMQIKEKRRMLQFKVRVFQRALKQEKFTYEKLKKGEQKRFDAYKPKYRTREELDAAYVVGALTDREYMWERSAIWRVWSDRGHIANIAWLEEELAKYEEALNTLDTWIKEKHDETVKRKQQRYRQKVKHRNYVRNKYRKNKRKELEARWKYYGIG